MSSETQNTPSDTTPERLIDIVPPGFNVIREGQAAVLVAKGHRVFYNNVQEFNRDLSILAISQFSQDKMDEQNAKAKKWLAHKNIDDIISTRLKKVRKAPYSPKSLRNVRLGGTDDDIQKDNSTDSPNDSDTLPTINKSDLDCTSPILPPHIHYKGLRVFEAFAASGLRSIRYFKEIPHIDTIHVNDMDPEAVESIHRNILYNQLPPDQIIPNKNDAVSALYANRATSHELQRQINFNKPSTIPERPEEIGDDHPLAFAYTRHYQVQSRHHTGDDDKASEDAPRSSDSSPSSEPSTATTTTTIGKQKYTSLVDDLIPGLQPWNVVDIDPYGSASPYLDAAIQGVESGGLLCITCTDSAILCGNYPETGFAKYSSMPLGGMFCKEMGLRLLLRTIENIATKYGRSITPLLSLSIDFYMRVFVRVNSSQLLCKFSASRHALVFQCVNCNSYFHQPAGSANPPFDPSKPIGKQQGAKYTYASQLVPEKCTNCQGRLRVGGPVWADPIHDKQFVSACLERLHRRQNGGEMTGFGTHQRLLGMLSMALSELDTLFYFEPSAFSRAVGTSTPKFQFVTAALLNAGYKVSQTHCSPGAIKTDAPNSFIWDIFRVFALINTKDDPAAYKRLSFIPRYTLSGGLSHITPENTPLEFSEDEKQQAEGFKLHTDRYQFSEAYGTTEFSKFILGQPMTHAINTHSSESIAKITMFFHNPEAYWGPKAMAGAFNITNLQSQLEEQENENTGKNIAQLLAIAQHEKARQKQSKTLSAEERERRKMEHIESNMRKRKLAEEAAAAKAASHSMDDGQ